MSVALPSVGNFASHQNLLIYSCGSVVFDSFSSSYLPSSEEVQGWPTCVCRTSCEKENILVRMRAIETRMMTWSDQKVNNAILFGPSPINRLMRQQRYGLRRWVDERT